MYIIMEEEGAVEPYDTNTDIMMNITLYKKGDSNNYRIYIKDNIKVTKPGKSEKEIPVIPNKAVVFDSTNVGEQSTIIQAITDLINGSETATEEGEATEEATEEATDAAKDSAATTATEGAVPPPPPPAHESSGGYSSKSVSFRPFKKRRTAKKRRGRK